MQQQYIVYAGSNLAVCESLREVYSFLRDLQARGITRANILGADLKVRLSDNGFWIWSQ